MPYHIKRDKDIQGRVETIYYQGDCRWSTSLEDRKIYQYKRDATAALYEYGGDVVSE